MNKRIYRSNSNKMIAGVCGGIGEYFGIDPTIVRLVFGLLVVMGCGSGILVYLLGAIIIPLAPYSTPNPANQEKASPDFDFETEKQNVDKKSDDSL